MAKFKVISSSDEKEFKQEASDSTPIIKVESASPVQEQPADFNYYVVVWESGVASISPVRGWCVFKKENHRDMISHIKSNIAPIAPNGYKIFTANMI